MADLFSTKLAANRFHCPPPLMRREIKIGEARTFDRSYVFGNNHGYKLVAVGSLVGDDSRLNEEYLLHHGKGGWTMLRRYKAVIDDVRVKGVGTLAFDSTYEWKLKKKVTPAWSERPFELNVAGQEDALTPSRITFIKEVIGNAAFKSAFETHVFRIYTEKFYPEFEAMPDDERKEWAGCYPTVGTPEEIWKLLGKKCALHVVSDDRFKLTADASWDPEHGLTIDVKDWRIE